MLTAFDHVNILTANLDALTAWYTDILGLKVGPRPDFEVDGVWLYLGDQPYVHLVEARKQPAAQEPGIEHFAFRAKGYEAFLDRLEAHGIEARLFDVPGYDIVQVNIRDSDGNHIHIDFDTSERA